MRAARGFLWLLSVPVAVLALALGTGAWGAAGGEVTVAGKLIDVHSDDFVRGQATHQYWLETDQGTYELGFSKSPALRSREQGARARSAQRKLDRVAAGGVTCSGKQVDEHGDGSEAGGRHPLHLLRQLDAAVHAGLANGVAFSNPDSVASYYARNLVGPASSSRATSSAGTPKDKSTSCDYTTWASDANAAVKAAGVDLSAYDYRVYAFPYVADCDWAGLVVHAGYAVVAQRRERDEPARHGPRARAQLRHPPRELVRLQRERRSRLTSANTANCTSTEYGDPFSVMGGLTRRQETNFSRGNFGWLSGANTLDVSQNGTYT